MIDICNLNRTGLAIERGKLLLDLHNYHQTLKEAIENFDESDTYLKKQRRIAKLIDSVIFLNSLTNKLNIFSGVCRNFLKKSIPYQQAKIRIDEFEVEESIN